MDKLRIFLVDDHQIMREGLRLVLARQDDFTVIGEAADGASALPLIEGAAPDIAIVDIEMPGLSGIELAGRLAISQPDTRVLILSAHADASVVREALRAGVSGFILKAGATDELVRAIRAIAGGEVFFCPQVSTLIANEYRRTETGVAGGVVLSERETDILRRIADGQSTKEIAFALQLSTKTVETHRANLMAKLGIFNVAGLTKYAVRAGLSTP
ncbi:MAG: response regulator transcription factor [Verrucomicrobia bacterium]|nr:response regulator transcription factor [Verrucomicrobiota bacterium]